MSDGMDAPPQVSAGAPDSPYALHTRGLLRNASLYWFGDLVTRGIQVVLLPIMGLVLTASAYGLYAAVGAGIAGVTAIGSLGMDAGLGRFVPVTPRSERPGLVGSGMIVVVVVSLATAVSATLIMRRSGYLDGLGDGLATWSLVAAFWVGAVGMSGVAVTRAAERASALTGVMLLRVVVLAVGVVGLWVLGAKSIWVAIGPLIASWIVFGVAATALSLPWARPRWSEASTLVRYSLPLVPHIAAVWVLSVSDRVLLQSIAGPTATGQYSFAYQVCTLVLLVGNAANSAWAPRYMRLGPGADDAGNRTYGVGMLYVVSLCALAVAGLSSRVLRLISRPTYWPGQEVMGVLCMAFLWTSLYYVVVNPLLKAGRTRAVAAATVAWAIVNIVMNLLLIPSLGIAAPAGATLVAYAGLTITILAVQGRRSADVIDIPSTAIVMALSTACLLAQYAVHGTARVVLTVAMMVGLVWILDVLRVVRVSSLPAIVRHAFARSETQ